MQAALQSPMWETRWRWNATRALAVLRSPGGKRTPPPLLRMRAADLLAAVFPAQAGCQDNHGGARETSSCPIIRSSTRPCATASRRPWTPTGLERGAAAPRRRARSRIAGARHDRRLAVRARDPERQPLRLPRRRAARGAPGARGADRRGRASFWRATAICCARSRGAIEPVVDEVAARAARRRRAARSAAAPSALVAAARRVARLATTRWRAAGRATALDARRARAGWVAAERMALAARLSPSARSSPALPALPRSTLRTRRRRARRSSAAALQTAGPMHRRERSRRARPRARAVDERAGAPRGRRPGPAGPLPPAADAIRIEWCERRPPAAHPPPHPRSRCASRCGRSRRAELIRFLLRWQHVQPGTRLHGVEGVLRRSSSSSRAASCRRRRGSATSCRRASQDYEPAWLDELCLSGEVAWARLRVDAARGRDAGARRARRRRDRRCSCARTRAWLVDPHARPTRRRRSGRTCRRWRARSPAQLERRGAAFAADLARAPAAASRRPASRTRCGSWSAPARSPATASPACARCSAPRAERPRRGVAGPLVAPAPRRAAPRRRRRPVRRRQPGRARPPLPAPLRHRHARSCSAARPRRRRGASCSHVYRRLEARGEIRGGRFVTGLSGEQFALPEAVEALRALRARTSRRPRTSRRSPPPIRSTCRHPHPRPARARRRRPLRALPRRRPGRACAAAYLPRMPRRARVAACSRRSGDLAYSLARWMLSVVRYGLWGQTVTVVSRPWLK